MSLRGGPRDRPGRTDALETAQAARLTLRKTAFEIGAFHHDIDDHVFARRPACDDDRGRRHPLYAASDATFSDIDGRVRHRFGAADRLTVFGDRVFF